MGKEAWHIRRGVGSFLTMEFGEPGREIREPVAVRPGTPPRIRRALSRRQVTIHGEWHLWIDQAAWCIEQRDETLAESESSDELIDEAAKQLDGQRLTAISRKSERQTTTFEFDLGGKLTTWARASKGSLWMLRPRSGDCFALKADGKVHSGPVDPAHKDWHWLRR